MVEHSCSTTTALPDAYGIGNRGLVCTATYCPAERRKSHRDSHSVALAVLISGFILGCTHSTSENASRAPARSAYTVLYPSMPNSTFAKLAILNPDGHSVEFLIDGASAVEALIDKPLREAVTDEHPEHYMIIGGIIVFEPGVGVRSYTLFSPWGHVMDHKGNYLIADLEPMREDLRKSTEGSLHILLGRDSNHFLGVDAR